MRHFVAYHSVNIMGEEYESKVIFHFIIRKSHKYLTQTVGNTLCAFSGKENVRRKNNYSLVAVFYPDEDYDKLKHILRSEGDYFDSPISVNKFEWFRSLLK